jgi:hypothetical protein
MELTFTSDACSGKKLVVHITNTGADLASTSFAWQSQVDELPSMTVALRSTALLLMVGVHVMVLFRIRMAANSSHLLLNKVVNSESISLLH